MVEVVWSHSCVHMIHLHPDFLTVNDVVNQVKCCWRVCKHTSLGGRDADAVRAKAEVCAFVCIAWCSDVRLVYAPWLANVTQLLVKCQAFFLLTEFNSVCLVSALVACLQMISVMCSWLVQVVLFIDCTVACVMLVMGISLIKALSKAMCPPNSFDNLQLFAMSLLYFLVDEMRHLGKTMHS